MEDYCCYCRTPLHRPTASLRFHTPTQPSWCSCCHSARARLLLSCHQRALLLCLTSTRLSKAHLIKPGHYLLDTLSLCYASSSITSPQAEFNCYSWHPHPAATRPHGCRSFACLARYRGCEQTLPLNTSVHCLSYIFRSPPS